jgi:hypothetical protein
MGSTGNMLMVIAEDASRIRWKTGGLTLDWNTVAAPVADTVLPDGNTILANKKGMQYGTVLTKITATGLYGPWTGAAGAATTVNGATAIGAGTITLTSATGIFPGDVLTIDTAGNIETARVRSVSGNVVTLAAPLTIAHANGVTAGKVDEGRATLTPGSVFVLNQSTLQDAPNSLGAFATNYPAGFYGGKVWQARLQVGGTNQPTLAQLLAACPELHPIAV